MHDYSNKLVGKRSRNPLATQPPLERSHGAKLLWLLWHGETVSAAELAALGVGSGHRLATVWDGGAVAYADACEAGDVSPSEWLPKPQPFNAELNTRLRKRLPLGDGRFV